MDDETVVALLSNETRLRIVRALGDLSDPGEFSVIPFTTLQEAVGVRDNGNFNYHLSKLTPAFVANTDEGYRLTLRGIYVYRTLRAAAFDSERLTDPQPVGVACPACDADLEAWVDGGRIHAACRACGGSESRYPVPAGGLERALAAEDGRMLYEMLSTRITHDSTAMLQGFCPYCSGAVDVELLSTEELGIATDVETTGLIARVACDHCHWFSYRGLTGILDAHPRVVPFLVRNGIDPYRSETYNEVTVEVDIESRDPWQLTATVECDGERLTLNLDGDLRTHEASVEQLE